MTSGVYQYYNVLLVGNRARLLVEILNTEKLTNHQSISILSRNLVMTASSVNLNLILFEKLGLIIRTKDGKIKKIKMTDKGKEIASMLAKIIILMQ